MSLAAPNGMTRNMGFATVTTGTNSIVMGPGGTTSVGVVSAQQSSSSFGIRDAASLGVDFAPVPLVGSAKSMVEFATGYDYIASRDTSRVLAAFGIVAGVAPYGKGLLKGAIEAFGAVGRSADGVLGVAKTTIASVPYRPAVIPEKVFHYTTKASAPSIAKSGLKPGAISGKVFTSPAGSYNPIEAQMYLGLSPNRGLPEALFEIDTAALRAFGIRLSSGPMSVLPTKNAMGYGQEIIFDQAIPPEAIRRIR